MPFSVLKSTTFSDFAKQNDPVWHHMFFLEKRWSLVAFYRICSQFLIPQWIHLSSAFDSCRKTEKTWRLNGDLCFLLAQRAEKVASLCPDPPALEAIISPHWKHVLKHEFPEWSVDWNSTNMQRPVYERVKIWLTAPLKDQMVHRKRPTPPSMKAKKERASSASPSWALLSPPHAGQSWTDYRPNHSCRSPTSTSGPHIWLFPSCRAWQHV